MSVKCLNCGYEMSTYQEVTSTLAHIASGFLKGSSNDNKKSILGGIMNQEVGNSKGVKCPNCGEVGRWED